jgi:pyruvate kinase
MGPSLKKETVLKRLINYVDVFRINLSHGGLAQAQRYVEAIRKIDASKAIMFDTKGPEVRVKNSIPVVLEGKKKINVFFSEGPVDSEDDIYIDYPYLDEVEK